MQVTSGGFCHVSIVAEGGAIVPRAAQAGQGSILGGRRSRSEGESMETGDMRGNGQEGWHFG